MSRPTTDFSPSFRRSLIPATALCFMMGSISVAYSQTQVPGQAASEQSADGIDDDPVAPSPKTKSAGVSLASKNAIRLNYGRPEWNSSAVKVDTAAILMREGTSGRIVQVEVEETAPDSAVFSGFYSINFRDLSALKVEFYAPPQSLLTDLAGRRKVSQMIESRELRRLPFVLRRDPVTGVQNVELFDNADQARLAYKAFQAEQELLVALKNRTDKRDQTLDAAALALEQAEFEEVSRNMAERVRLSQVESQRLASLLQKFSLAQPEARARAKADAQKSAREAMVDYEAGRYAEARKKFEASIEADPSNRTYYFQYGVTLYKLEDFNRALVYFDLTDAKAADHVEMDFYRGLSLYRLRDSTAALEAFQRVVNAKDPEISPSARFYRGVIHFDRHRWEQSRTEFQAVLDESKDAVLDQRAESYIERALRMQQLEAERSRRWTFVGTFGGLYDDNVLLSSDSDRDRGVATNSAAWRALLQGMVKYRAMYEEKNEWAIQLDAMTMYSVDQDFQTSQAISNSDATIVGITLPWTHKSVVRGKGYKLDVIPGFETTYMSIENNEFKPIYNSYVLNFQNLFVMSETWFTNLNIDLRQDVSGLNSSTGDDDSTAFKSKVTWANINMPFEDRRQLVVSDLAYTNNSSLGKNSVFNRLDLGVGYIRPSFWDMTFSSKLGYFMLNYPQNASGRSDSNITLTLGLNKKLSEKLMSGFMTSYSVNSSNVTVNEYKKLTAMITFTAVEAF